MSEWLLMKEVGAIIRTEKTREIKKFIRDNSIRVCKPLGKILVSKDDVNFVLEQKTVRLD